MTSATDHSPLQASHLEFLPLRLADKSPDDIEQHFVVVDADGAQIFAIDAGRDRAQDVVDLYNSHDSLVKALEEINGLLSGERHTVNEANAFEHFSALNKTVVDARKIARAALQTAKAGRT